MFSICVPGRGFSFTVGIILFSGAALAGANLRLEEAAAVLHEHQPSSLRTCAARLLSAVGLAQERERLRVALYAWRKKQPGVDDAEFVTRATQYFDQLDDLHRERFSHSHEDIALQLILSLAQVDPTDWHERAWGLELEQLRRETAALRSALRTSLQRYREGTKREELRTARDRVHQTVHILAARQGWNFMRRDHRWLETATTAASASETKKQR